MQPYPLVFKPILKQTIWGGRRLGDQLGKPIGTESDYAESWELVDHGNDQSIVAEGPLAGRTLSELIANEPDWLIGDTASKGRFPLLLKYLDCNRVLSVQVHPDDAYGAKMTRPDLGKTEAWYIVAADPGSLIYAGLESGVDRSTLEQAIRAGETEQMLHSSHHMPATLCSSRPVQSMPSELACWSPRSNSPATRLFDCSIGIASTLMATGDRYTFVKA